jgi:hypothetical protein
MHLQNGRSAGEVTSVLTLVGSSLFALFLLFSPSPVLTAESSFPAQSQALHEVAQKLAAAFPSLSGYVLSTEGGQIYIDLGERERVYPGMELDLYREGEPFSHPITGEVLGRLEKALGRIRVIDVREKFSIALQTSRTEEGPVLKGDRVRMTRARIPLALPTIEMVDAKEEEAKSITRELALALTRTERFEVWEERRLLSELQSQGIASPISFTDPRVMEILSRKLNIPLLALGKASGLFFDLQAFSTSTGSLLTVASSEIRSLASQPPPREARPLFPPQGTSFSPPSPPETPVEPTIGSAAIWRGPRLEKALRAMVVADVNGDGRPELVLADKNQIMIYSIEASGSRLLQALPKETSLNILSLDAADINGNGIAEIFVTSHFQGRLNSLVLEYRDGKFVKLWENINLLLRCLPNPDHPQGGFRLFGQVLGPPDRPWGKIREYSWSSNGNGYREGPSLDPPVPASLYGLALMDLDGDGKREYILLSQSNRIEIYGEDGKRKYRSSDEYGGTSLTIEVTPYFSPPSSPTSPMHLPESQKAESFYLQPRLFPVPGTSQFYVCKNLESSLSILKGVRFFERSKIYRLGWDGDALQPLWESRELPNYLADYFIGDFDGDGTLEAAVLLVDKKLIGQDKSTVNIFRL